MEKLALIGTLFQTFTMKKPGALILKLWINSAIFLNVKQGLGTYWNTSPIRRRSNMTRKKNPISQTRGLLYGLAKLLGDVSAVQKGTVGKRIARRAAGRVAGGLLGRLFR